jgi:hypothetical protein
VSVSGHSDPTSRLLNIIVSTCAGTTTTVVNQPLPLAR